MRMEPVLEKTLLYDFYGELLTEHQRTVYEAVVLNDLSYTEAAEDFGISRQGVHELVKRCTRILEGYEEKLHLLERFLKVRRKVEQIRELAAEDAEQDPQELIGRICEISGSILEEL